MAEEQQDIIKLSENERMLSFLNGDDGKEEKRQGLTSVGIKDAAHQASAGVEG